MGTGATDNPVQQVQQMQHVQRPDTYPLCAVPGWSKSADSDNPPPGAAITPTRRAKTPSQNPMRTTTTHVGF